MRMRLVEQMLAVVAYAELRAIFLVWAGIRTWDPAIRARGCVARALADGVAEDIVEQAQGLLRDESRALLGPAIVRMAPWPYPQVLGHGQIGSTDGLEATFHAAGKLAAVHRGNDPRVMSLALSLADFVRGYEAVRVKPA